MYCIKTRGGFLNGFYPNGLPTGSRMEYVEKYQRLLPKLKLSEVILQSGGKLIFNTEAEAKDYIHYVKKTINEESDRYEYVRPGSTACLLEIADSFKVKAC